MLINDSIKNLAYTLDIMERGRVKYHKASVKDILPTYISTTLKNEVLWQLYYTNITFVLCQLSQKIVYTDRNIHISNYSIIAVVFYKMINVKIYISNKALYINKEM